MPSVKLTPQKFLTDLEKRQQRGLAAAGLVYLQTMAWTLSGKGHGREYWVYKGRLYPVNKEKFVSSWAVRHSWDFERFKNKKNQWDFRTVGGRLRPAGARIHIASAPGEPPAVLFGDLRKRTASRIERLADGDLTMLFGSRVPYAAHWEKPKDPAVRRPAWEPTMQAAWGHMLKAYGLAMLRQAAKTPGRK